MQSTALVRTLSYQHRRHRKRQRCRAQPAASSQSRASFSTGGSRAVLKSALISCSFCAAGDIISQTVAAFLGERKGFRINASRVSRMAGFGLLLHGPFQHVWYRALEFRFPRKTLPDFISKVVLNQIVLGPIMITTSFAWNLTFTGQGATLPDKLRRDFWTTLTNGWKLWIPAAIANFRLIPAESQVLFMSFVSLCWTTYLGYQSNKALIQKGPATT